MLFDLESLDSRAANAENRLGERSAGGRTGGGRKGAPCKENLMPGETYTLLETDGPGIIRHIWLTFPPSKPVLLRTLILRIYWEESEEASVEVPVGDFFGIAHARWKPLVTSMTSFMNARGLNAWFPMPFRKHAKIEITNLSGKCVPMLFYQVDFTLGDSLDISAGYFHAQYRRHTPRFGEDYIILDTGENGQGRFLGCVLGVRKNAGIPGWWGEGEVKMHFDGETLPTICGTGVEDYIGMAWGLAEFSAPDQGCALADNDSGLYSLYRFHVRDPICFAGSLKVTVQQMGYGSAAEAEAALGKEFHKYRAAGHHASDDMCYFDRSDDYSSCAFWYQKQIAASGSRNLTFDELTKGVLDSASVLDRKDT